MEIRGLGGAETATTTAECASRRQQANMLTVISLRNNKQSIISKVAPVYCISPAPPIKVAYLPLETKGPYLQTEVDKSWLLISNRNDNCSISCSSLVKQAHFSFELIGKLVQMAHV